VINDSALYVNKRLIARNIAVELDKILFLGGGFESKIFL